VAGESLVELGDDAPVEIVVDVLTTDAVRIEPGHPAVISNWGGPPTSAVVQRVEPAGFTRLSPLGVEEQRVNVILAFDDCPPAMGIGYRLDASIRVWSTPRTLVAPSSATFRRGNQWSVFVVEDGRVYLRAVEVGERTAGFVQIVSGLRAGDVVVVFPGDDLTDGARVRLRPARAAD
jgi:HlyD family secretion protein